ncbi:MAG: tetratricopeptide repeat protein, partial [Promethearchaeota archaeon]
MSKREEMQNKIELRQQQRLNRRRIGDLDIDPAQQIAEAFMNQHGGLSMISQQKSSFHNADKSISHYQGIKLLEEMKFKDAEDYYFSFVKSHPSNAEAWNNAGVALMSMRNRKDALYCYERAIENKKKNYIAMYNKGAVYFWCDKFKEAEEWFDKALKINPKCGEAFFDRVLARENLGQLDFSFDRRAREKGIDIMRARQNGGSALVDLGKKKDNIIGFIKVLFKHQEKLNDLHDAAVIYEEYEEISLAIAKYEEGLKLNPECTTFWYYKGRLHSILKNIDEALVCFDNAVKF